MYSDQDNTKMWSFGLAGLKPEGSFCILRRFCDCSASGMDKSAETSGGLTLSF